MYSSYIQEAAAAMADRMNQSPVPLYGSKLRLPNRQAVILLIKEIRKLMFPAYFGDPELMSLAHSRARGGAAARADCPRPA